MNIQRFTRQEIALGQIETALELFGRTGELFSVITLAGAAEEILGELLQQRDAKGVWGKLTSIFDILRPAGRTKERAETLAGHELDDTVHMDPLHEGVFLLGRAIEDYIELTGAPTPAMLKFLSERTST